MKVTTRNKNTIEGAPNVIVRLMRDAGLFEFLAEEATTNAERAESLPREMERQNMIHIEEQGAEQ